MPLNTMSNSLMKILNHLSGLKLLTKSSKPLHDFVSELLGQDTRSALRPYFSNSPASLVTQIPDWTTAIELKAIGIFLKSALTTFGSKKIVTRSMSYQAIRWRRMLEFPNGTSSTDGG